MSKCNAGYDLPNTLIHLNRDSQTSDLGNIRRERLIFGLANSDSGLSGLSA